MDTGSVELIERIGAVRRAARRAVAARLGLSLAQLDALEYLASCNRYSDTPAAVAAFLDTTRGTASQSLKTLERKGLVARTGDARDGRVRHLRVSDAGLALLAEVHADDVTAAVAGLGRDREDELARLLEAVLETAQRRRGGRTFGLCRTCRHLEGAPGDHRCGLTGEALSAADTALRCAEHSPRTAGVEPEGGTGDPRATGPHAIHPVGSEWAILDLNQ
ncbi:MAG: MarR family winged helix-turn-helix transcriptional regulator [Thermoleophilia bacterium]|nr:MarR family winged helix-turn-helix transcriptional regulator [Thermoleophilia bacterium]